MRALPLSLAAALAWILTAWTAARVEDAFAVMPVDGMVLYAQDSDDEEDEDDGSAAPPDRRTYQRIRRQGDALVAEYGFINFNKDRLLVNYGLKSAAWSAYDAGFGYYKRDLKALDAWHDAARDAAYKQVLARRGSQAQLDAEMESLKRQYDRKVKDYMAARGFKILRKNLVSVDMPALVRKNAPHVKSLSLSIDQVAQRRRYGSDELAGAVASLAQTAMIYKIPPPMDGERHTGGMLPPVTALLKGWGDCDTKTGVIAAILANWPHMRMVGLALPGHYLMGVLRIPAKGDVFVEHEGLQYVLIESAGPAWLPPGTVGDETLAKLQHASYEIEPFF